MAINEDQIRKLIEDYEGYKRECMEACTDIGSAKAGLYHVVLHDLKELLPRKTLADVAGDNLEPYFGTWVEYDNREALIIGLGEDCVRFFVPMTRLVTWEETSKVFPLDISRALDESGAIGY